MIELLAGALAGAGTGTAVRRMYDDWDEPQDVGHFFMVIDPEATVGAAAFAEATAGVVASLEATPPAPGVERVIVPGEIEAERERMHGESGIALPPTLVRELLSLSHRYAVAPPDAATSIPSTWS